MKVLIIVDMQYDFIYGALGTQEAQAIVPVMRERIKEYEDGNTMVIFTKDTHYDEYLNTQEGKNLPIEHCKFMTSGWSIVKEISSAVDYGNFIKYSSDRVINSRFNKSAFGSISLARCVAEMVEDEDVNIEEIILMGVCTDICVVSNAMLLKAYCPETLITVDASCCAGVTPESHKAALTTMKMCQINVIGE